MHVAIVNITWAKVIPQSLAFKKATEKKLVEK